MQKTYTKERNTFKVIGLRYLRTIHYTMIQRSIRMKSRKRKSRSGIATYTLIEVPAVIGGHIYHSGMQLMFSL